MRTAVGGAERVTRRQLGPRVAAGQSDRARVTGRHVAIRIVGRHRHRAVRARRVAGGETGECQRLRRRRLHGDLRLGARDAWRHRIGRGDRLRAGGIERDRKTQLARVGGRECGARRQRGLRISAPQQDGAGVAGRHVAIRVIGRDCHGAARARRIAGREPGECQRLRRRRLHHNARLGGAQARRHRISRGDRLCAGRIEGHGEAQLARVGGGEGGARW